MWPVPWPQRLVRQLLEERQHLQELVDGALALQVSRPLPQALGQPLAADLEAQHAFVHGVDLGHHVHPQQVAVAVNGRDHVRVQPGFMRTWWVWRLRLCNAIFTMS